VEAQVEQLQLVDDLELVVVAVLVVLAVEVLHLVRVLVLKADLVELVRRPLPELAVVVVIQQLEQLVLFQVMVAQVLQ
jgi:hypothetical protein